MASHGDRLWLIGGNSSGCEENYADIWSSRDGSAWTRIPSPWPGRGLQSLIRYRDRLWLFGGMRTIRPGADKQMKSANDLWVSPDGIDWQRLPDAPPWKPRCSVGEVVFRDRVWLFGGVRGDSPGKLADVWHFGIHNTTEAHYGTAERTSQSV